MLWKFTNKNKYGNLRSRIVYRPDGEPFSYNPKGLGNFVAVRSFKYMSQSPFLIVTGKQYGFLNYHICFYL